LIAGGDHALRNSIEDAEDSLDQAARDLTELSPPVSEIDFVVGITASGTTPYVHGALRFARGVGATTCLMSCNPASCDWAQQQIVLETGPEVLPGSTRLKAGSVTKLALNQITTGAMARCGHIYDGYMVGVRSVNAKLHERTVRITSELLDVSKQEAQRNLDAAAGDIKVAVLMVRLDIPKEDAEGRLDKTGGHLRDALDL
jgi:N-acetylmuramic acid 6-phosphate etherase